jgi:hypothetical protein
MDVDAALGAGAHRVGVPAVAAVTTTDATAPTGRDLLVTAMANPPRTALPGSADVVTDTTVNQGPAVAAASTTRFYLSLDGAKGPGDSRGSSRPDCE